MPALLALDISDSGSNSSHGRFLKFLKWKKQLLHMELSHRLQTTAASCQCQQDSAAVIIGHRFDLMEVVRCLALANRLTNHV